MDVHAIRARIPLMQTCLYFNTGGISPTLDVVSDSLIHDIREIGETGPPPIMRPDEYHQRLQSARERLADFCGAEPENLCLTRGVADGVTTVFNGLDWQTGDELVLTDEEHPAVRIPADRLPAGHGVKLKYLPIDGSAEEVLSRLEQMITSKTKMLALSHVTTDTGTRLPARQIVELAHSRSVPVLYDGAQSLGQFPVDVTDIGADFYSALSYKWMFGPYSAGWLYIDPAWHDRLKVVPSSANYFADDGIRRFEFVTMPTIYYTASAAGTDYLSAVGIDKIEQHTADLAGRLRTGLAAIPGLAIESPSEPGMSTGVVAFQVAGFEGPYISTQLRERQIITRPTGLKFSGVRVSVAMFTTAADVDAVIGAVDEIVRAGAPA
ncbi:MAG: hypothetical protein CME13_14285 [Gemmatimonadetes bacterium]|jgi:selenocysteine lyase/cysteine desulfurase|nr:hypothetical protein [Gemmatimonadota bacterium]|tara:strand:+ start:359 stop:1498 length:1140 start_codon:yes stop_codon:yes gene_type:complete